MDWNTGPSGDENVTLVASESPAPTSLSPDDKQSQTIHFVALGIIIPVGFIFNILSFVVFGTCKKFRNTTTGHYLLALAVADTLFLIGEFIRWLNLPDKDHLGVFIDFLDRIDLLCRTTMWFRYGSKLASAWITVVITVERFTSVAFPLRVTQLSTPKIAKIVIAAIFVFSFAGGAFPLWTVAVQPSKDSTACSITDKVTYNIFNWIFLRTLSLFIPGILIIIFCILIAIFLSRAKNDSTRKLSTNSLRLSGSRTSSRSLERQLTVMLLAVCVAFISLRLPYTVVYYIYVLYKTKTYGDPLDVNMKYRLSCSLKMTDIFVSINYSINFFLYCLCGRTFRRQLKRLLNCQTGRRYTDSFMMASRVGTRYHNKPMSPNGKKLTMSRPKFYETKI